MSESIWRYFRHPDTKQVQRIHHSHKGHINILLRHGWEEIEKPDDS